MAGIQTGLTDAELLASQLKAHELVGLEASISDIDDSVLNTKMEEYKYGSENEFSSMTLSGGDLISTEYSNPNFHNLSPSQLVSVSIKAETNGIATIKVYSIDVSNNITLLHSYAPIVVSAGVNQYIIEDTYIVKEGSFFCIAVPSSQLLVYWK